MNDIRSKFEEIWPVPAGVYWHDKHGCYLPYGDECKAARYAIARGAAAFGEKL